MLIVIADDQIRSRQSLRALLSASLSRVDIREAANGEEALSLVEELQPRLVVMDIRMPKLDGLEATRRIKQRWPAVKVLVLSIYQDREREAGEAGADLFMCKGEPPERLLGALSSFL
jgi:DNA-binding NarL/FixJ family response regulator